MIRLIDSLPIFFVEMYFLEKLCRICVQTGAPLVDIDTVDFDLIRLSEKLQVCANLVIIKDPVSSEICEKCVNKLRVSYHFLDMCKKSTKLIQGYLGKLTNSEESHSCADFESSELDVELEKLPEYKTDYDDDFADHSETHKEASENSKTSVLRKKQRITKEQRCSLLKQLLNRPKKERDKSIYSHNTYGYEKGGLKNIIDFTKNYEFSFNLDKNSNIESTPLDRLTAFSRNYFTRDFSEFKTHILYVIENRHDFIGSDDEDYLSETSEESDNRDLKVEELTVEPDIKIKHEASDCDDEECPLDYLETTFEEDADVKVKNEEHQSDSETDNFYQSASIKEATQKNLGFDLSTIPLDYKASLSINSSPAVKLLDKLVSSYPISSRKVFSTSNVRCRTRDQPYINPLLKNQFLYRSFKCERCNRYFKSQGYLKAHTSKVH